MKLLKRKGFLLLVGFLLVITFGYFLTFFRLYSEVKRDFVILDDTENLGKYLYLYSLTYDRTPNSINDFKNFVRDNDINYYKIIEDLDLKFIKDKNARFDFYLPGFDKKDDSLKTSYHPLTVSFWESINKKGDILLSNSYNLPTYNNGVHKIFNDTLIKAHEIDISQFYLKNFKCGNIYLSSFDTEHKKLTLRLKNQEFRFLDNTFSDESTQFFLDEIKKEKYFTHNDSIYLIKVKDYDVSDYKCSPRSR